MDRLEELERQGLNVRLLNGSAFLGQDWREGHRCRDGWKGSCSCGADATRLCKDKMLWVKLLLDYHGGAWPYELTGTEDFAIIEAMTQKKMFEASGLTARVGLPGVETPLRIGKSGGAEWMVLLELALIPPGEERDEAIRGVQKIQKVFA